MDKHPSWTQTLFAEGDLDAIGSAIEAAERETSAEIRVHLERTVPRRPGQEGSDVLGRAREIFVRLGMHQTALRHGVLIYVALEDHRVAILGDEGIHTRVEEHYWADVRDLMVSRFRQGAAATALIEAVHDLGRSLARHFPRRPDDTNELSDSVSLG